ncbi:MAG TPA: VWA domain-containing protein [Pyrinomonadaceae bacterium]|nr:VWA domain-containing protein [Pyrinomonadaceae bacterium]
MKYKVVGSKKLRWLVTLLFILPLLLIGPNARMQEPAEVIRIESDLVDLKVSVIARNTSTPTPLLTQKDFTVREDGTPQEITFFAAADTPFDLVLLLDLSGSNKKNLKMIRNSAKRFVEAARDVDRIALVAFTDQVWIYSPFTLDRAKLKKAIDEMDEAEGGTNFWDSLDYVLRVLVHHNQETRRSAVVVMTDGVDNALPDVAGIGSQITFDRLLVQVENSDSVVFPIYLDTEEESVRRYHVPRAAYAIARQQLGQIAATCGTELYRASKLSDLDQLYSRVIDDLRTVYSISYRPSNRAPDGKWRTVNVELPNRPELVARTKRGYYAKQFPSQ